MLVVYIVYYGINMEQVYILPGLENIFLSLFWQQNPKNKDFLYKGLFIWNEKTFRLAKYFCSVHMAKRYPTYQIKFPAVT